MSGVKRTDNSDEAAAFASAEIHARLAARAAITPIEEAEQASERALELLGELRRSHWGSAHFCKIRALVEQLEAASNVDELADALRDILHWQTDTLRQTAKGRRLPGDRRLPFHNVQQEVSDALVRLEATLTDTRRA